MTDCSKQGETVRVSPWIRFQTVLLAGIAVLLVVCVVLLASTVTKLRVR